MSKIAFTGHRDKLTDVSFLDTIPRYYHLWAHGGAEGFDSQVEQYAREHNIRTLVHEPDYSRYGKSAPLVRNRYIIHDAILLVACYDGRLTGGTYYTINIAKKAGIPIVYAPISQT